MEEHFHLLRRLLDVPCMTKRRGRPPQVDREYPVYDPDAARWFGVVMGLGGDTPTDRSYTIPRILMIQQTSVPAWPT